jgi:phosphoribosyl-AMP cyclohydrolase / phosphoribosyl-ATP pyrophosphohydrolase
MRYEMISWAEMALCTDERGLLPAIVQDADTDAVLMLGYVNAEAWAETMRSGRVCFFSRSRQRLWTKGESSGHFLLLESWRVDCDRDTLLLRVRPQGPTCHTGADTCWQEPNPARFTLAALEKIIQARRDHPHAGSYTARLLEKGIAAIAQKVGEEAVETVIEALRDDRERLLNESADLLYHLLVLLSAKGCRLAEVEAVLAARGK